MPLSKKLTAEFIGTFWLVLGGCGSAVLAAKFPEIGIGLVGVALAFGLTVVTMAYAVGHISGGHFNPAVTVGLFAGGRTSAGELLPYILAQLAGGILAALVLYAIASGKPGFDLAGGFAANGYGEHSPGGYSLIAALIIEVVLTAGFLFVIMGATDSRAPSGLAPLAIGLTLTLIHLISIPVTNTSVNPAQHRPGITGRRLGLGAIMAVLVGADPRRDCRRRRLSLALDGGAGSGARYRRGARRGLTGIRAGAGRIGRPAPIQRQRTENDPGDQAKGRAGIGVDQASLHAFLTCFAAARLPAAPALQPYTAPARPRGGLNLGLAPSISMLISRSEVSPDLPRLTRIMSSRIST